MASQNVEELPKVLKTSLEELIQGEELVNWSINSNNSVTSVVLRFAKPGHISNAPVTWRKSPSQLRRDRNRMDSYTHNYEYHTVQTESFNMHQNTGINDGNNNVVCDQLYNVSFDRTPISAPVLDSPDHVCLPEETGENEASTNSVDLDGEASTHVNKQCETVLESITHPKVLITELSDNNSESSEESIESVENEENPVQLELNGTKDDFVKVCQDWRTCETDVYFRGLVKDGRIVEIVLGSVGPLKVMDQSSENYNEVCEYVKDKEGCGWNLSIWQPTADSMLNLWRKYLEDHGEIT